MKLPKGISTVEIGFDEMVLLDDYEKLLKMVLRLSLEYNILEDTCGRLGLNYNEVLVTLGE